MRTLVAVVIALMLTMASAWINPPTDERAMYGHEGLLEQNLLPRKVAGWPAPFIADSTVTSVIHQIGVEDDFRAGPFIATWSFWLMLVLFVRKLTTQG